MVQLRRTAANAAAYDLECELLTPAQAQERWPVMAGRRPAGGDLAARRRQGQPDRRDPGAGPRRPAGRRPDRRAGAGHRRSRSPRPRPAAGSPASGTDRGGERRGRGGRQLRGPVGARRWATWSASRSRCTPPSTSTSSPSRSTASTRTCRSCATRTAGPTSRRRSAAWWSGGFEPEAKPWRSPDDHPVPVRVPAARRGLGALLGADGRGGAPDPGARRDRDPEVLQRPGVVHPGQPVPAGGGPGAARLLRRRRLQLRRHRLGRRRRTRPGRVDRRGRADDGPGRGRRPPVRAVPRQQHAGCGPGSPRCSACTTRCPGRTASSRPRGRSAARRCTTGSPPRARSSASRMGWERPNVFAPAGRAAPRLHVGEAGLAAVVGRASSAPPATDVAVFDQTSFSKYPVPGPGALAGAAVALRRRRRRAGRRLRLHAAAQRAGAPTRPT